MYCIRSERIKAEICEPQEGRNQTTRFDRTGFVRQITLDGVHTFCGEEPGEKMAKGAGLCSEIRGITIDKKIRAGRPFPKFGVGLLTGPWDKPYDFQSDYQCRSFPVKVHMKKNSVHADSSCSIRREAESVFFEIEPAPWEGYAVRERKAVCVQGNELKVSYYFRNVGERAMLLEEYCHNFLQLNGGSTGKDFRLKLLDDHNTQKKMMIPDCMMLETNGGFGFAGTESGISLAEVQWKGKCSGQPYVWKLYQVSTGLSVCERTSFSPDHLVIWSSPKAFSPEVYYRFRINPGEEISYDRVWNFDGPDK